MIKTSFYAAAASAFIASSCFAADLTIYTYDSFNSEWGPGPQLEKSFEATCQCDIEFIALDDGVSILNRARIEKSLTKADVLLGLDDSLTEVTREEQLVQPHDLDLSVLSSALQWSDNSFVPFDYGYFSFIYDSSKIDKPVDSLKGLIESDATVIYQDPRTSTPGQGFMLWVNAVYGDDAAKAWTRLAPHTVTVTKGWWEAYSMFLEGGSDYVLSYNTSPAYHHVVDGESKYKAALFNDGHVAQIEVAAISRYSDNPTLAKEFLAFLISPTAQQIIPTSNWMLPVIDNVELPPVFSTLIKPTRIGFTPADVAEKRKAMINTWRSSAQ